MKKEPMMVFENQEQLDECFQWWKNKLMLHDWIIQCKLVDYLPTCNDEECLGKHNSSYVQKVSYIDIATKKACEDFLNKEGSEICYKFCHELTLVHELLHVKMPMYFCDDGNISTKSYEISQHALIESLAKSLIMAKYDLDFEWFSNL